MSDYPFKVPDNRFDQRNEMFKRAWWDEKFQQECQRFYKEAKFQKKVGYRKLDYALRNASWNLEWSSAFGNSRSNHGLFSWEGVPEKVRHFVVEEGPVTSPPQEMSRTVKQAARFFGADLVGIAGLHPNLVYSHEYNLMTHEHYPLEIPEGCNHAIVVAVEMDYGVMRLPPNGIAGAGTGLGYSKMAFVANLLATFIRNLGYQAIPSGNDTALSVPLAMAAGLGETGRHGLLITKKFGPRVRLCKVFTDLPLTHDRYRPFGVKEFCDLCKACADKCPGRAIDHGDQTLEGKSISNHNGILKWYVDAERCFEFWAKNRMDCCTCVRVCPFNKPTGLLHDFIRALIKLRSPSLSRVILRGEDLLGYGKPDDSSKFW